MCYYYFHVTDEEMEAQKVKHVAPNHTANKWFSWLQFVLLSTMCCALLSHSVVSRLFVTPRTVAHQALLSMEILQARILVWLAMPFSRGSSQSRDRTQISCIAGGFFTI